MVWKHEPWNKITIFRAINHQESNESSKKTKIGVPVTKQMNETPHIGNWFIRQEKISVTGSSLCYWTKNEESPHKAGMTLISLEERNNLLLQNHSSKIILNKQLSSFSYCGIGTLDTQGIYYYFFQGQAYLYQLWSFFGNRKMTSETFLLYKDLQWEKEIRTEKGNTDSTILCGENY